MGVGEPPELHLEGAPRLGPLEVVGPGEGDLLDPDPVVADVDGRKVDEGVSREAELRGLRDALRPESAVLPAIGLVPDLALDAADGVQGLKGRRVLEGERDRAFGELAVELDLDARLAGDLLD